MGQDLWYPDLLQEKEAFPASVMFTFFDRESTKRSIIQDTIHLYLPEQFGQPSTVSWDQFSGAGALTEVAANGLEGVEGILRNPLAKGVAAFARGGLNKLSGGGPASDLLQINQGVMPNPYLAQIFRGVNFRTFAMSFRLVPLSERDCDTIYEIIKTFRKWALPTGPAGGAASPYLNYPGEVEVEYQWMGATNKFLHRFKRSVISSLDIDYTGAGMWAMMRNGFPAETVVNVEFSEIQIVVREDIEEGY